MADTPYSENPVITDFEILADGTKISDTIQVRSVSVKLEINKIPHAKISIYDWDQSALDFTVSKAGTFKRGVKIVINAGYDSAKQQIFSGVVIQNHISASSSGIPTLDIECEDVIRKMTIGRKNTYFVKQKDSDIISTLVSNNGGSATVDATSAQHEMLIQENLSDWDFMLSRAEVNSMAVIVDSGAVTVKKPNLNDTSVLTCSYGIDMFTFNGEINSESQIDKVIVTAWDISSQATIQVTVSNPNASSNSSELEVRTFEMKTAANVTQDDLTAWANAQMDKFLLSQKKGSASFKGSAKVKPGTIIEFKNVSTLSGPAYISSVDHSLEGGNWTTSVGLGLSAEWFTEKVGIQGPGTAGPVSGNSKLTIGKVKQLDQDPDTQYRIMITLPLMQDDNEGVWARLSSYYATSSAGSFFIPEIEDEVIVGFLNDDPGTPVVLGSLYSSSNKAPSDLTKDNYTKALITKALNKMEFDDENKVITITTPGNNQAVMSDKDKSVTIKDQNSNSIVMNEDGITIKDKNGNKIVLSSSGIEINSASDVKISASQNIKASATSNLDLSATQNVSISGLQISNSANTAFKATGNATAELSSTGQTTIKGAMVMIN